MASTSPVILAFEDLQWADSGLLDFIDYLREWSAEFPIFIVGLGRPEVQARRTDWGTLVSLPPLAPQAMRTLLDSVASGLPAELTDRILERAEGVPLYAVEIVRMLLDRGVLVQEGSHYRLASTVAELEVPETLQALIAARLDDLDASERALLQDAAVLGMSFSPAALAAVSGRPLAEVQPTLDALVKKQVLGYADDPRGGEQGQYHFLQALVRTVAFNTLSRRDRKARHLAAADHLRATWPDPTEGAEVLASHYLAAVEADPEAADADNIRASARETLAAAGHRAVSLALGVEARHYFEQAAALAADEAEKARLLAAAGAAAARTADRAGAQALLSDAINVLDASGRTEDAARTRAQLARVLIDENRFQEAGGLIDEARQAATDEAVLAELAARRAAIAFLSGDNARARQEAELALSIADPRDLKPLVAEAAMTKGCALLYEHRQTEADAMVSLGLRLAVDADLTEQALRGYFDVAELRLTSGDPATAATLLEKGLALARERGNRVWERDLLAQQVGAHAFTGEWDEALALADSMQAAGEDDSARLARTYVPMILAARGDERGLDGWLAKPRRDSEWHELSLMESVGRAVALRARGRSTEARQIFIEAAPTMATIGGLTFMFHLGEALDALLEANQVAKLEGLLRAPAPLGLPLLRGEFERARGLLDARNGELVEAEAALARSAEHLRAAGNPFALARDLLDHGGILIELGLEGRARPVLEEARLLFARLRATPWIAKSERVLVPVAA
jgi:hypothetical protein